MERLKYLQIDQLRMVGEGAQGRVYQMDATTCVKIYKKEKYFRRELECLHRGSAATLFPKVFEWDHGRMVREFIPGAPLSEYLKTHRASPEIFQQLLELYHTLEKLRFKRLDTRLDHIIITNEQILRLIDPTNLMNDRETIPRRMLSGLEIVGWKKAFLKFVREKEPRLADRWGFKEYPHARGKKNISFFSSIYHSNGH